MAQLKRKRKRIKPLKNMNIYDIIYRLVRTVL